MPSLIKRIILAAFCLQIPTAATPPSPAPIYSYHVLGDEPGPWPQIFSSIGMTAGGGAAPTTGLSSLVVVRSGSTTVPAQWAARVDEGAILVLEGESELAESFGFKSGARHVPVRNVIDLRSPKLPIIWEKTLDLPVFEIPKDSTIFAKERWTNAPLMAGFGRGAGAILWIAVTPGVHGQERFPYLLQALSDLGFKAPFRSSRLWAFFDSSYRSRVDLDYFADRWRKAGIGTLHVAAWHYYEANPERDEYLRRLIDACHRKAILVYAWLELPHVSEKFWQDHPDWREKTALLQDAHLDWRKLMNLGNRDCFHAVAKGVSGLIGKFDWDGVNLAELYFESLEGASNPARFTPMNGDVRREFQQTSGFDPLEIFQPSSAHSQSKDPAALRAFLDYRAELARRMQREWITEMEGARKSKRNLDLVLTHVDDRFDTRMRDLIGADAARVLPLLEQHDFTFLIEDPATIWHLGPQRYPQIAKRYEPLTKLQNKLAIDINIVPRYQDVYPTKQQTGTELFQLVHLAAMAFPRVALYFEHSILGADLPFLSSAAATVTQASQIGAKLAIDSRDGVGIPWNGPALVNGRPWPLRNETTLWLPPGPNAVEPAANEVALRILDFNGNLQAATSLAKGVEFAYQSNSRAMAVLDKRPKSIEIDGVPATLDLITSGNTFVLLLPRGQHLITISS